MPKWHFKLAVSSFVKRNMKSGGKRSIFLLTCRFICARSTWYNMAKSLSIYNLLSSHCDDFSFNGIKSISS